MKSFPTIVLLCLCGSLREPPAPQTETDVRDTSFTAPDGTRVQRLDLVVGASPKEVWDAFTTTEGVRSWAVPVAKVDFRLGGEWESTYEVNGKIGHPHNIKNRFLSYVPLRMIAIQAIQAPPTFPHPELLAEIFHVIEIDDLGEKRARVTVCGVGYKSGEGYDAIYRHFEGGNAWSLRRLRKRFEEGPVDWKKALSPAGDRSDRR